MSKLTIWGKRKLRAWLEIPNREYPPCDYVVAAVSYRDHGIYIFMRNGQIYRYAAFGPNEDMILMRMEAGVKCPRP